MSSTGSCGLCCRAEQKLLYPFANNPKVVWAPATSRRICQDCYRMLLHARKFPNEESMLALFAQTTRPAFSELKQLRLCLNRLARPEHFTGKSKGRNCRAGDRDDSDSETQDDAQENDDTGSDGDSDENEDDGDHDEHDDAGKIQTHCRLCNRDGIKLPCLFVENPKVKWAGDEGMYICQQCYRMLLHARKFPSDKGMLALFAKSTRPALSEIYQLRNRLYRLVNPRGYKEKLQPQSKNAANAGAAGGKSRTDDQDDSDSEVYSDEEQNDRFQDDAENEDCDDEVDDSGCDEDDSGCDPRRRL